MPLKTCVMPEMSHITSWQQQSISNQTRYLQQFSGSDQSALKQGLEASATQAIGLLDTNIQEDSLYLLFEWNPATAVLNVVVTDAHKQHDSSASVQAILPELPVMLSALDTTERATCINTLNDTIKFLLSDFLASYSPFFSYSLVAIFHSSSRTETSLL